MGAPVRAVADLRGAHYTDSNPPPHRSAPGHSVYRLLVYSSDSYKTGSGVLISPDGVMATAYHVVFDMQTGAFLSPLVEMDGRFLASVDPADLLVVDPQKDYVEFRVEALRGRPYLPFSDAPSFVEPVWVIGYPHMTLSQYEGQRHYSIGRVTSFNPDTGVVQMTAEAVGGYSGGAIVQGGRLVGIVRSVRNVSAWKLDWVLIEGESEGYYPLSRQSEK